MYSSYATFAAVTLEVTKKPLIIKWCWIGLLIFSGITTILHISKAILWGPGITTITTYSISRLTTIFIAGFALAMAWRVRTSVFQKIIILGSYVYAFFAMLSVFSFIYRQTYFGLSGIEPYMLGSFIDIIIFSGALGYRFKKIADQKNYLLQQSLATAESRTNIAKSLNDDVGAALSSMHVYASVAETLLEKNPAESKDYIKQIKNNSLQVMEDVSDIVWALRLTPEIIPEALPIRIKQRALELLEAKEIACTYDLENVAMESIQDVATAKKVLQQVNDGLKIIIEKPLYKNITVSIKLAQNELKVNVF